MSAGSRTSWSALVATVLLASAVVPAPARAQVAPLRLADVLDAIARNPNFQAAAAAVARAGGQELAANGAFDVRVRAGGELFPVGYYERTLLDVEVRAPLRYSGITPFVGWRRGRGDFPIYDFKALTEEFGEIRGGIEMPVFRDRSIDRARADLSKAELADDVARAELAQRVLELELMGTVAYWRWVAAGHRLRVREQQLQLAVDRASGLQRQIDQGTTPRIEATDNARVIAQREALVVAARRDVTRTARELSLFARDANGVPMAPTIERLPPLPAPEGPGAQTPPRPLPILAALGFRLATTAIDVDLAENQLLPTFSVRAFAARGFGPFDPRIPDRAETSVGLGFVFELPLQQRQARGALAIARADASRLRAEQRALTDRVNADLDVTAAELEAALERSTLLATTAQLAAELADAERRKFAAGASTILVVNLREEAAADAAAGRIDAIAEYLEAHARHAVARGNSPR
ncbi:MAG: TolC family protein [Kofleriaceae bacterium]|nr:TolC family protein [Kofleriaceae bacterium]